MFPYCEYSAENASQKFQSSSIGLQWLAIRSHFPNLDICNYFCKFFIKEMHSLNNPCTADKLKAETESVIGIIDENMLPARVCALCSLLTKRYIHLLFLH
jgi:hypothetical protein